MYIDEYPDPKKIKTHRLMHTLIRQIFTDIYKTTQINIQSKQNTQTKQMNTKTRQIDIQMRNITTHD